MHRRISALAIVVLILLSSVTFAQESAKVDALLKEVDQWVTTDTTKIMHYIDSCNALTTKMLESSKYWEPTMSDLSFLLGIDLVGSAQIDNTGRIYFEMRITGETQSLFYMDAPMSWPMQMTPNNWASEGLGISYYSVHPSGNFTLVGVDKFGDEMHDIWYFSRDGKFRPLIENRLVRYAGPIFDDDNPDVFYLTIQDANGPMRIGRYTISTAKLDTVYFEQGAYYSTDYQKNKLLFVRYVSFSESQLCMLDVPSGKVTNLTDTTLISAAGFTQDGRVIALTKALSKENEFQKVCLLDPAKPGEFKLLFDPKMEMEDYTFIDKKGVVVASLNKDGYSEFAAFDLTGKPVVVPQPAIGVAGGLTSNDLGDVMFSFSSPTVAPTAFKMSIGNTKLEQIGKISTFGFDFSNITVELIRYKSDDGTMIPALLYKPSTAKQDGSNPAIVNYHGGPPSQNRPGFQRNIAFALSKGFILLWPNPRGSTGYGPAFEKADNLEGRYAANIDCERALDYLIDNKWSSPSKIAIWGGSYGGYVVDWLATNAPDKIACAVSEVGVSDVDHTNKQSRNQAFSRGWEREMGPVGSELTHKLSPIFYSEKLTKPILVTAGFNDPRVPPSDPRRFAYVLSRLGKPVWYYEETEAGHGASMKAQLIRDFTASYVFTMEHVMK